MVHSMAIEEVASAVISISIVDTATMRKLNNQHLQHDYPTDVISFQLNWEHPNHDAPPARPTGRSAGAKVEGEIVVCADFAAEMAPQCGWEPQSELTLYAIHGMLHICGYDDLTPSEKAIMRSREIAVLSGIGMNPEYPDDVDDEPPGSDGSVEESDGSEAFE